MPSYSFIVCLLLTILLVSGCQVFSRPDGQVADPYQLEWGVFLPDDLAESSDLRTVMQMASSTPRYVLRFAALNERTPVPELNVIADAGAVPILTLEPWQPGAGTDQPDYSLARIAAGLFDAQLDLWGRNLANWGRPLILRFAHEMNSDHYPWSVNVNGNTGADYIAAWKHVRQRFLFAGADNVSFMWCPDAPYEGSGDMAAAFPGTDEVDVLGLDGYNWGDGQGHTWKTPQDIFSAGLEQLRSLHAKAPIIIGETASVEGPRSGVDKADWTRALFELLASEDRVIGVVWFQMMKERDWRFNSSTEAQSAFKDAVSAQSPP